MIERLVGMLDDIGRVATDLRSVAAHELPDVIGDLSLKLDDVASESTNLIGRVDDVRPMLELGDEAVQHASVAHAVGVDLLLGNVDDASRGVSQLADSLPDWASSAHQRAFDAAYHVPSLTDDWIAGIGTHGDDLAGGFDDAARRADDMWRESDELWRQQQDALNSAILLDDVGGGFTAFDDGFGLFG